MFLISLRPKRCGIEKLGPWALSYVPDQYKTQEMCNEAVEKSPEVLEHVPEHLNTQEMWNREVQSSPWMLEHVFDQFVM